MSQTSDPCQLTCPLTNGAAHPADPTLDHVLARYQHEAVRGVCETGRYRCPFFTWGEGPPLVLVPGVGGDARSFMLLCARLANQFRCIAYDLPQGLGDGARLGAYTHGELVEDLFALLDHLGERRAYLCAFSFGATIALAATHSRPERLPRAVLVSGFASRRLAPAERLVAQLGRHWQSPTWRLPFFELLFRQVHRAAFSELSPEVWRFFVKCFGVHTVAAIAAQALLLHQVDVRPLLGEVRQPVLLISGDQDPLVDMSSLETLQRGLPNAAHVEMTHCGHCAHFTHPGQLAEVVRGFLLPPSASQPPMCSSSTLASG